MFDCEPMATAERDRVLGDEDRFAKQNAMILINDSNVWYWKGDWQLRSVATRDVAVRVAPRAHRQDAPSRCLKKIPSAPDIEHRWSHARGGFDAFVAVVGISQSSGHP